MLPSHGRAEKRWLRQCDSPPWPGNRWRSNRASKCRGRPNGSEVANKLHIRSKFRAGLEASLERWPATAPATGRYWRVYLSIWIIKAAFFFLKNGYSPQHKFKSRKFIKLVLILLVNLAVLLRFSNFISVHYKPSQDSDKIWTLKSDTFMKTWRYLGNEIHTWLKRSCWAIKSLSVWKHHSKIEWLCLGMLSQSRPFN